MTQFQCLFWGISIFIFDDNSRSEAEFWRAIREAREAMREDVRALNMADPRLAGEIPIRLYPHNVPELKFSITVGCNREDHSHQLGSLTISRPEDRKPESPTHKIYEAARRAFRAQGFTIP
jgi:hypothetical protein